MASHSKVIQDNLCSLCDKSNISLRLLDKCVEVGILTRYESVKIEKYSEYEQNRKFYDTIRRKDSEAFKELVALMESKNTLQSNDVLVILKNSESSLVHKRKGLKCKWWPDERNFNLINSFHERKMKDKLFVQELHNMLTHNPNGIAVISQKVAVSGLGGVGKTTTAKWYANHYKDYYDHIIWLDCGEGSLLKSFYDLARELDIKNRQDLELTKIARESFSALEGFKCLWIFDNAECYAGNQGIRDVLPTNREFHSLITSRNREWGNVTGYGKISQFQLDVFDIEESIAFMKNNIQDKSFHDGDLKQLCRLLGNLPLALQIAAATLNRQKFKLTDYIERVENTDHIITKDFDDYEKTINATLKISLEFMKDKDNKNDLKRLAYRILMVFGYIRPENVEFSFFERVEESTKYVVEEAMDLWEKYSLISKRQIVSNAFSNDEVVMYHYSIHRLLQQVTRHNVRAAKKDTIRKILSCEGLLSYKLVPFTLADEELNNEFPEIRAQLIDQIELSQLIKERNFTEALQLSEIIKNAMKSPASDFNYAICLKNQRELKAVLKVFYEIYNAVPNSGIGQNLRQYQYDVTYTELVDLNFEPSKVIVASQLFIIHLQERRFEMADQILRKQSKVFVGNSEDAAS